MNSKAIYNICIALLGIFSVACSEITVKENILPTPDPGASAITFPTANPTEPNPTVSVEAVMEIDKTEIEVAYTGGEITFVTTTNQAFTVSSIAEWITIDSDGRAETADYTVKATVSANDGEAREGNITVTFDDEANTVKEVIIKQVAYMSPDQTPQTPVVPELEIEIVTVALDIVPGSAGTTISAEEVATKLGVENLAAAIADGSVIYVGLNADETVYTLEDGSTPSSTTNGPVGHWYNSDCNPILWGTPDPAGTGAVRLAYLEGDGVTYTLGYDNSGLFVAGDSYTLSGKYIYGDAEVKLEVVINVVETPASSFVAPDADYLINVQVVQDNAWGATWIALDGTVVENWGAYSDPTKYVTPIADVSVDITPAIEATLGIEEGTLEDALLGGDVVLGSYNANNEFMDCYEVKGSNYFYWFDEDGSALSTYAGFACIDNLGFVSEELCLYGTACLMPNATVIGEIYPTYIIFKSYYNDAEYVVLINQEAVAAPEKQPSISDYDYSLVTTFDKVYEVYNPGAYTTPDPIFSIEDIIYDINGALGGEPDLILMSYYDDNSELAFQEWTVTDGWFGTDGAAGWGSQTQMFCLKPNSDGTFEYCAALMDCVGEANVTLRYCNITYRKAVDVNVQVILRDEPIEDNTDDTFEFSPMGQVVNVAADGSSYFNATVNCPEGYTLIKYDYTEWGMSNIYSEYQDFWCYVEDDNAGNISVSFEANETGSARKAYIFVMPTSAYEDLNGDVDSFFIADQYAEVWEMSNQASQYLIAEFHQESEEIDDTFEFSPMGQVVDVAADGSSYFNATVNCTAGYTLIKYYYDDVWGMVQIISEYQDFWCYVEDDNAGNISVSFESNETGSARTAYLFVMPTSVYESLNGEVDALFVEDVNVNVWEMSDQAAQYLIAEFHQNTYSSTITNNLNVTWASDATEAQKSVLTNLVNNMVLVEGGTFMMGSDDIDAYSDERPVHSVTLTNDYYMGKFEVTQEEWVAVMGSNPSYFNGTNLPVEEVSWDDIVNDFLPELKRLTGLRFRLPTEAEWEFAARGGNKSQGYKYSGSNTIDNVAWYYSNSSGMTHAVGTKLPNELGLYDMCGNVNEWCSDRYGSYSSSSQTNPTGPATGSSCMLRGGYFGLYACNCRVSARDYRYSYIEEYDRGFRLVL